MWQVFESSDIVSHLLQWNTLNEIACLSNCCISLSFTPYRCNYSSDENVHGVVSKFCSSLDSYESNYDKLLKRFPANFSTVSALFPSFHDSSSSSSSSFSFSASSCSSCSSSMHSNKFQILSQNESTEAMNTQTPPLPPPSSSLPLPLSQCIPHSKYALRTLKLRNFVINLSHFRFLSTHLYHFNFIQRMYIVVAGTLFPSVLPKYLKYLVCRAISAIAAQPFPQTLQILEIGEVLSRHTIQFPPNLHKLILNGAKLSEDCQLPNSLEELYGLNQIPTHTLLPSSLKILRLYYLMKDSLLPNSLPQDLHTLQLGGYNGPLDSSIFPPSLTKLYLGHAFNHPLQTNSLPNSLLSLHLSERFNQPLLVGHLKEGLTELHLGRCYNHPLVAGVLPFTLITLTLSDWYSYPILPSILPHSLRHLIIQGNFPLSCLSENGVLPQSFEWIAFNEFWQLHDNVKVFPLSVKEVRIFVGSLNFESEKMNKLKKDVRIIVQTLPNLRIRWWETSDFCDENAEKIIPFLS